MPQLCGAQASSLLPLPCSEEGQARISLWHGYFMDTGVCTQPTNMSHCALPSQEPVDTGIPWQAAYLVPAGCVATPAPLALLIFHVCTSGQGISHVSILRSSVHMGRKGVPLSSLYSQRTADPHCGWIRHVKFQCIGFVCVLVYSNRYMCTCMHYTLLQKLCTTYTEGRGEGRQWLIAECFIGSTFRAVLVSQRATACHSTGTSTPHVEGGR